MCARVIATIALSLVAIPAFAQMRELVGHDTLDQDRLMVVFDEQRLTDAARAQLISFVATAVPVDRWQVVTTGAATTLEGLVDKYYDLFNAGEYRTPLSVITMTSEIRRGNPGLTAGIPAGTTLRMPPFPVRGRGQYRVGADLRVFDTVAHSYSLRQGVGAANLSARPRLQAASELGSQRDASTTAIVMDIGPELLKSGIRSVALPPAVLALSAHPANENGSSVKAGWLDVALLAEPAAQDCAAAFNLLNTSPFRAAQRQIVQQLPDSVKAKMLELAGQTPLVIMDVGFGHAHQHGAKVHKVAVATLNELGLGHLTTAVKRYELIPSDDQSAKELSTTLTQYLASKPAVPENQITPALEWIARTRLDPGAPPPVIAVPEVLLQAVLWQHFVTGAWMNMSFRTDSGAMRIVLQRFRSNIAANFAAAGNDHRELGTGWVPHDGALAFRNFVIVTHGDETGRVDGDFTRSDGGPPVALVAPGCGFQDIPDRGSSLASPYVAATVWSRYLLELATATAPEPPAPVPEPLLKRLLHELVVASRPVPAQTDPIESGGVFDAAHFFVRAVRPHLAWADGTAIEVKRLELTVSCASGPTLNFRFPDNGFSKNWSVAVYPSGTQQGLWLREAESGVPPRIRRSCDIASFALKAITEDGRELSWDATEFAKQVKWLSW